MSVPKHEWGLRQIAERLESGEGAGLTLLVAAVNSLEKQMEPSVLAGLLRDMAAKVLRDEIAVVESKRLDY